MNQYATIDNVIYPFGMAVKGEKETQAAGDSAGDIGRARREANYFEQVVRNYLGKEGKELAGYLQDKGYRFVELKGVGSATLEDQVVAALLRYNGSGVLVSNAKGGGFRERIAEFAKQYGVSEKLAREYVLSHELVHAAKVNDEQKVERVLGQYFSEKAGKTEDALEKENYQKLAGVAKKREAAYKLGKGKEKVYDSDKAKEAYEKAA